MGFMKRNSAGNCAEEANGRFEMFLFVELIYVCASIRLINRQVAPIKNETWDFFGQRIFQTVLK